MVYMPLLHKGQKIGRKKHPADQLRAFAGDCLIDFPPETFSQAEKYGIDLLTSKLLLVTHSHEDHFYPQLLYWRYRPKEAEELPEEERFARGLSRQQELPVLHIFGNACTYQKLMENFGGQSLEESALTFTHPGVV